MSRAELDDQALMRLVVEGDTDALTQLYQRHHRRVRAEARRRLLTGGLDEEIVNDVFLHVWRRPDRYDPTRGELVTWLQIVARNTAVDRWRAETSRATGRAVPIVNDDGNEHLQLPAGPAADANLVESQVIRDALGALPARLRELVVLAYWGGHTVAEIAELMDVPTGTVKTRSFDARERLRLQLGALGWEAGR